MINIQHLRENFEEFCQIQMARKTDPSLLDEIKSMDQEWRMLQIKVDEHRHVLKQSSPKGKPNQEQLLQLKTLSDTIKQLEGECKAVKATLDDKLLHIPNILEKSVAHGNDESDNSIIKKVGHIPTFNFNILPHEQLAEQLSLVDFERATKVSGSRFNIYTGTGAKLERGLIQFMLDTHTDSHGYKELLPPVIINQKSLTGTGQLPKFSDDSYHLSDTELWLSPTAEVQLTNFYRDEIIAEKDLPIKLTAYSPCFRKESGSYGKDIKGLIRLHQFNKVELVKICTPEDSMKELHSLLEDAESILKALELPYRIVKLCSGDTGFSAAITYDIEVWFPSQNTYREISSCSNFFDFQARRAMIRYKDSDKKNSQYTHTINGSGLAVGRTFAALLENHQNKDGSITIPKCLRPYINKDTIGR